MAKCVLRGYVKGQAWKARKNALDQFDNALVHKEGLLCYIEYGSRYTKVLVIHECTNKCPGWV